MLIICPTLDYEIFFGKNFLSLNNILIKPTYTLHKIFRKHGYFFTLYVDVLFLLRCHELGLHKYFIPIEEQLKILCKEGHDIQLHIHPNWLKAQYIESDNVWNYDFNYYNLKDFEHLQQNERLSVENIFLDAKHYLEELLKPVDKHYKVDSFRGGGWTLQPISKVIKILHNLCVSTDTTIFWGGYKNTQTHSFDYRNVPKNINWFISSKTGIIPSNLQNDECILEIPIGSLKYSIFRRLYYKMRKKIISPPFYPEKGKYIGNTILNSEIHFRQKISDLFSPQPWLFSVDQLDLHELKYHLKRYSKNTISKNIALSLTGHPKDLNPYKFNIIDNFLTYITTHNYVKLLPVIQAKSVLNNFKPSNI